MRNSISRRNFLKLAGSGFLAAAGASVLPRFMGRKLLQPAEVAFAQTTTPDLYFAGTDGWIAMPPSPNIGFYFPDDLAPANFNTYIFGFRNVTGLDATQIGQQKMKAQHSAPMFWVDEYTGANEFHMQLTNLGLQMRPDLTDSHTLHWHGFRNVIPFFDGEPTGSISVPVGRNFTYVFRPRDPGTYMYHCHVEDVEHVHMGMTGPVFVRPAQNGNTSLYASGKFAYNDGDGSTGYDREFAMFLSEVWAEAHWCDSHIQLPDWSDYKADFSLLNGRAYPDTLAPNAPIDAATSHHALSVERDAGGDLIAPAGRPDLQYQPLSALVTCLPNERVLLRFSNLGFREAAMALAGIKMRVIGRDATMMRGLGSTGLRNGADTSYATNTVLIGPGESYDVLFTAPDFSGGSGSSGQGYDSYVLYNRRLTQVSNLDASTFGGQRTEVRVYPGGLAAQQYPNDLGV
ncbi:MAG: multicopper oxidase domain-containing protein [Caldilineaceae bacterium]|nr:multicopper oxidase domain-containing protein [Caldilineaceae bacterium]